MGRTFNELIAGLPGALARLVASAPVNVAEARRTLPKRGVYLFSQNGAHLYVGRSNNIPARYGRHCNEGATHRMASFAFRLARIETNNLKATYKPGAGSRQHLMENEEFVRAFDAARALIRGMEFRCVEEADPVKQCLLEVYCAVELRTPHNDFDTH